MSVRMATAIFILSLLLCVEVAWARINLNPGKWKITTKTEMTGMGNIDMAPITHTQCLTEADLVPQSKEASNECQISEIHQHGNTVSWKIICSGQGGQMVGTGQVTYNGDSLHGTMDMDITGAGMHVKNIITGRRIGECDSSKTSQPVQQSTCKQSQQKPTAEKNALAEDAKDVGKAAKDETKQSTINEVRKGIRGLFKGVFD